MRTAGILMPITSLPSPYGVGTLGQCARDFIQFLHRAGQTYWQILPICPTGYGDSPYQSFSSYARSWFPMSIFGGGITVWNGIVFIKSAEVVDADHIVDF